MTSVARFRNDRALFAWGFAALWDAATLLLAWIVFTSPEPLVKGLLALAVFGAAAAGLTWWALVSPRVAVEVLPDGSVDIVESTILRRQRRHIPSRDVGAARVVQESNGEEGDYWVCRVTFLREPLDIVASGDQGKVEAAAARFNAAAHPVAGATAR